MAMSGDAFLGQTTLARPTARELWTFACAALGGRDGPHPGTRLARSPTKRHAAMEMSIVTPLVKFVARILSGSLQAQNQQGRRDLTVGDS